MASSQQDSLERNRGTTDKVSHYVSDHPDESILTAFAAGAAIGLIIGLTMGESSSSSSRSWRDRRVAEGLGNRLMESLDSLLPDSVTGAFGRK